MENRMFCYQCQETAKGTGCILKGVCGKDAATARSMDLLLFVVRGIAVAADRLRNSGVEVAHDVDEFVVDALFSTITNANFDRESIEQRVERALAVRDALKAKAEAMGVGLPAADEQMGSNLGTRHRIARPNICHSNHARWSGNDSSSCGPIY